MKNKGSINATLVFIIVILSGSLVYTFITKNPKNIISKDDEDANGMELTQPPVEDEISKKPIKDLDISGEIKSGDELNITSDTNEQVQTFFVAVSGPPGTLFNNFLSELNLTPPTVFSDPISEFEYDLEAPEPVIAPMISRVNLEVVFKDFITIDEVNNLLSSINGRVTFVKDIKNKIINIEIPDSQDATKIIQIAEFLNQSKGVFIARPRLLHGTMQTTDT